MAMNEASREKPSTLLCFDGFTLNILRRGLFRGEDRVRLTAKPLETLIYLVENSGRVVSKQELLDAVWKGTFVTEDTLVHAIREIRRALGDDRDNPRFVLTIPREGYRFVCDVQEQSSAELQPISGLAQPRIEPSTEPNPPLQDTAERSADSAEPGDALRISRSNRRRWLIPFLSSVMLIGGGSIWLATQPWTTQFLADFFRNRTPLPTPPRAVNQKLLTETTFSEGKPALSGDGELLVYVSTNPFDNEKTPDGQLKTFGDLFVKKVATGESVQITHQENPSGDIPVFTADHNFVVFANYPKRDSGSSLPSLYKVGSGGGNYDKNDQLIVGERVPYVREASGAGFSPDGQWVAYTKHLSNRKVLWLSPANDPEASHKEIAPVGFTPRWSADAKWLAYTTSNPQGGPGDIFVMDSTSLSNPRNLTNEPQQIYGLTWTPDGRSLIFSSKRTGPALLWRVPFEGGPVEPVTGPIGDFSAPSMSTQSNMLVFAYYHGAQNLIVSEGLGADARNLTADEYHEFVRLSPSGTLVASVMQQPNFGEHLYVTDLQGSHTSLNDHASQHPAWLDENRVAYLQWDQSRQQTQVVQINITDLRKPEATTLTSFPGRASWLDVNPVDERELAVVRTTGEKEEIVVRNLATGQDLVIASGSEYAHLRWSSDGSQLAWSGPEESGKESAGIWIIKPALETTPERIVFEGFGPVWGHSNSVIYFARIASQSGLYEYDLRTKTVDKRRDWRQTPYFDVVGDRLVYCELSSSGKTRVYSLTVE